LLAPEGLEHADSAQPDLGLPLPDLTDEPEGPVLSLEPADEVSNHPPVLSLPWWEPPGIDGDSPLEIPVDVAPSDPVIESLRAEDAP
jgi:hypothetical protein